MSGVPVASVLSSDIDAAQPYMILERLPGEDLGMVFDQLTDVQLRRIASAVVEMQDRACRLRRAGGFGYALDYETQLRPSWHAVLESSIERSAGWIREAGAVDPSSAPDDQPSTPTSRLHQWITEKVWLIVSTSTQPFTAWAFLPNSVSSSTSRRPRRSM